MGGLMGICSQSPGFARNVCRLAPFLLPKPKSTPGVTIGRWASSDSCARPAWAARSLPKARAVHRGLRGAMPVIRGDEPDGDAGLDPDRPSLRDEAFGPVLVREPAIGNRILDPDALEHSSGVCPVGIAGMPAREPEARWEGCGICERPRALLGERLEAFKS